MSGLGEKVPLTTRYSLIIPFFNEEESAPEVIREARAFLQSLPTHEMILINDGSTDRTGQLLAAEAADDPRVKILNFPKNLGQAEALRHGLLAAQGEILLTMDGDGQNDPKDFSRLLPAVEGGQQDLICGWRFPRNDSWIRRTMSWLANQIRSRFLGDHLHDSGCQLRVMRKGVLDSIFPFELMQSFLPAMVLAGGFRVSEVQVNHRPRLRGEAKYNLRKLWWRPAMAMLRIAPRLRERRRKVSL